MKHVLLIQFRRNEVLLKEEREAFERSFGSSVAVKALDANTAPEHAFDPTSALNGIHGVVLGGSGDFSLARETDGSDKAAVPILNKVSPLLRTLLKSDFPTLGVCFGHQLLARTLGIEIITDPAQKEVGSYMVYPTSAGRESILYQGTPESFMAQFGHQKSLAELPEGAVLLASTDRCKLASMQYREHIFSVIFHPELQQEDMLKRLEQSPAYLGQQEEGGAIKASPHAAILFANFIRVMERFEGMHG